MIIFTNLLKMFKLEEVLKNLFKVIIEFHASPDDWLDFIKIR